MHPSMVPDDQFAFALLLNDRMEPYVLTVKLRYELPEGNDVGLKVVERVRAR